MSGDMGKDGYEYIEEGKKGRGFNWAGHGHRVVLIVKLGGRMGGEGIEANGVLFCTRKEE